MDGKIDYQEFIIAAQLQLENPEKSTLAVTPVFEYVILTKTEEQVMVEIDQPIIDRISLIRELDTPEEVVGLDMTPCSRPSPTFNEEELANISPTTQIEAAPRKETSIADAILTRIDNLNLESVVKDTQKIETPKFID